MMVLVFSRVNAAWLFMFGDAPCQFANSPMFYSQRWEAIESARDCGLTVAANGCVAVA